MKNNLFKRTFSAMLAAVTLLACVSCAANTDFSIKQEAQVAGLGKSAKAQTTDTPDTGSLKYETNTETGIAADVNAPSEAEVMMDAVMEAPAVMYMPAPKLDTHGEWNTEEYSAITENGYKSVADEPLSTFSADVDTAAYSNVRRMIMDGYGDTDWGAVSLAEAVRLEEMINYFDYDYDVPNASGETPFAVTTEYSDCPWNADTKLLLIGIQAKEIDMSEKQPSNFVFLLDVSGSMYDDDKLPLVQKAFTMLVSELSPSDRISIVVYAGTDAVLLEGADGGDTGKITEIFDSLTAGGSTHGSAGIETAYELAERYFIDGGNNRVILATDGDFNIGVTSESALKKLVEEKRDGGVYLTVLGFGEGNIKDNKMETLADWGNGNYYYIDSVLEAKKVLVEQMGGTLYTVAKDVKLQVEFNPQYVKGYRLVGYENRLLNTEDFNDDTKDAGEIGAGHRVTALYEIVTVDSAMELSAAELKYQTASAPTGSDELLTVSLRYKEPDSDTSTLVEVPVTADSYAAELPENLSFAAGVAEFGMLLRDSDYKGAATYRSVYDRLGSLAGVTSDAYKTEFLYLVSLFLR